MAKGKLEVPIGTVLLEFIVADFLIRENFIIMKNLPKPFHWSLLSPLKQCNIPCHARHLDVPVPLNAAKTRHTSSNTSNPIVCRKYIYLRTRQNCRHSKQKATPVGQRCNRNSYIFNPIRTARQPFHHIVAQYG